ncbi:MAG: glycosyltransferase [candidate division KSB1 bacterium]|nr:glycosyltransferase [candidate division KSB1 bacterium]
MGKKKSKKSPPPKQQHPRLSVCMIVKNEEKLLPRCLESVKDVADEIIIVDTGSTDRTIEIAHQFGAKVYHHPWQNDFSLHRNQSISYATGDWILQIDADEELDAQSGPILKEIIATAPEEIHAFMVLIQDVRADGSPHVLFNFPRLFRNHVGIHYISRVHNQVVINGKVLFSKIRLIHYGYDLDRKTMLKKFKRSMTLLKDWRKKEPENPTPYFYLACTYSQYQRPKKCIDYALKTLKLLRKEKTSPPFFLTIYYALVAALIQINRLEEAEKYAQESIAVFDEYLDGYYLLSSIHYVQQNFKQAVYFGDRYLKLLKEYRNQPEKIGGLNLYTIGKEAKFRYWYGISHMALGNLQKGLESIHQAMDDPHGKIPMALEACYNSMVVADVQTAKSLFQKLYFRFYEDSAFTLKIAQTLARLDRLVWLSDWSQEKRPIVTPKEDILLQFFIHLLLNNKQEAKAILSNLDITALPDKRLSEILIWVKELWGDSPIERLDKNELILAYNVIKYLSRYILEDDLEEEEYYLILYNTLQENNTDHQIKEMSLILGLIEVEKNIQMENVDALLMNMRMLCHWLQIPFPMEFEDIHQILNLLINIIRECDARNMPDAATTAMALAYQFFPDSLSSQTIRLNRQIVRSQFLGNYSEWLRLLLKYIYPDGETITSIKEKLAPLLRKKDSMEDISVI